MNDEEIALRITHLPKFGCKRIHRLLNEYKTIQEVWQASTDEVAQLLNHGDLTTIWQQRNSYQEWLRDKELVDAKGIQLIACWSSSYPKSLLNIADPPILLYAKGDLRCLRSSAIAVIGTRNPSPYGLAMAERFAGALASAGCCVVSGLARGIDGAAHRSALRHGNTVAVIGSGLAALYPREHTALAEAIAERGAIISELPMSTPPDRLCFPRRNRIISGLSEAILLIEASKKSGAVTTLELGRREGKRCYALPGRIDYPSFEGNHLLLQRGDAQLVTTPEELLASDHGDLFSPPAPLPSLSADEKNLLRLMVAGDYTIDELCLLTQWHVAKVSSVVTALQLKQCIREYPGKRYQKLAHEKTTHHR